MKAHVSIQDTARSILQHARDNATWPIEGAEMDLYQTLSEWNQRGFSEADLRDIAAALVEQAASE